MSKQDNPLGAYLKDRRGRLDPAALGISKRRRRTPGLRREEVAQRADISPAWYTWLEQGRGGAPSAEVLDRIARGLLLSDSEREHLFMLGLGHPPQVKYAPADGIPPRLQRLLDSLEISPAIIKTATWDVVGWNRAAAVVLTDYGSLPATERNILRLVFCDPRVRASQDDWDSVARFVVAAFRADVTRAGAVQEVTRFVDDLCGRSPAFAALWREHEVQPHGDGVKRLRHAALGPIELEYSSFAVDGRPDLGMIVYSPVTGSDTDRIRSLIRLNAPSQTDAKAEKVQRPGRRVRGRSSAF